MKRFLYIFLVTFCCSPALHAQEYAYFYIEGDQQTPIYVKVEGKMQERFGENHFIIPDLDAGYTHFEILFQKNIYPPQEFLLEVPKAGSRGFVLHKINDRQFALYDLQQKRYVVSGNTKEDDHAPEITGYIAGATGQQATENTSSIPATQGTLPEFNPASTSKKDAQSGTDDPDPRFLENIELNAPSAAAGHEAAAGPGSSDEQRNEPKTNGKRQRPGKDDLSRLPALKYNDDMELEENKSAAEDQSVDTIPEPAVTGCPGPMDNDEFENFALEFLNRPDDDQKLKFLRKNKNPHCFSAEQVRIITKSLDTQSGRYEAAKMLYGKTADQENYDKLESLFNTPFLKTKFKEIFQR